MSPHTTCARGGILFALTVALLLPTLALASDPTPPAEVLDDGPGFRFKLGLGVPLGSVAVSTIYNRVAGAVVDAAADSVNGLPVRRQLAMQWDAAQGRYFTDAHPFAPGQPPLPNGVYSQWLEVRYTPGLEARGRAPSTYRRTIYFRVTDGTVQRLTRAAYAALVDPGFLRKNKLGEMEPVHAGATAPRQTSAVMPQMTMIESGQAYSVPGNGEAGQ